MMREGPGQPRLLQYVVSQNVDGLHRKSGIPQDRIAEVHGNTNLEICSKCKKSYMRDFRVRNATTTHDHKTGRTCDDSACRGILKDSIINFGENLDEDILNAGFENCKMADLALCMGSSLRVTPAADMPKETAANGYGNLVIINLQKTPLDSMATLVIHGKCDDVMEKVMQKLDRNIPTWQLTKRARLQKLAKPDHFSICGIDTDGSPY